MLLALRHLRKEKKSSEYHIFVIGIICILSLLVAIAIGFYVRSNVGKYGLTLVANTWVRSDFSQADQLFLSQLISPSQIQSLTVVAANKNFLVAGNLCNSIVTGTAVPGMKIFSL